MIVLCIIIISVLQQRAITSNLNAFKYTPTIISNSESSSNSILTKGDAVIIEDSFLGNTKEIASKISGFAINKDITSIMDLIYDGQAFAIEKGTTAIIQDISFTLYEVRITSGSQIGKKGWLPKEFVK